MGNETRGEREITVNFGIRLTEMPDGLAFGTDALLLSAFIRPFPHGRAIELGTGSGVISLLCAAQGKFAHIEALEIQPDYAALAARNAERNGLGERISAVCADIRTYRTPEVDAVFTNPPYMVPSGVESPSAHRQIARHEVCGTLFDFCAAGGRMLRYGGQFTCVCRPDRTVDLLCAMRQADIEPKRLLTVYEDDAHPPCLLLAEGKKGAKPGLRTPPPLFLKKNGEPTDAYRNLLQNGVLA